MPGARPLGEGRWRFEVWAPRGRALAVVLEGGGRRALAREDGGWFTGELEDVAPGARYWLELDGVRLPDPASRRQPAGAFGPSALVDPSFPWSDAAWRGVPWSEWVIYELHVGTFTPAGTFRGVIEQLPRLRALGVTVLELLPVVETSGRWNWGYDGVFPWAVKEGYGGARGLQELVDAAHAHGLGVVLDVVMNHLGPEGNVLDRFGPYTHAGAPTPWGPGTNLDGEGSAAVRGYWLESALHWLEAHHVDGLRLDAADTLVDRSPRPFLAELGAAWDARAAALGRAAHLVAEVAQPLRAPITPREAGGWGFAGAWCDDLHCALMALLTGERAGYYADFGRLEQLVTAFERGAVFAGEPSVYRGRPWGEPLDHEPARLVVCAQNHDQVGNRPRGDRLAARVQPAEQRLAAAVTLLAPTTPLLFMGEEWGETAPFPFFVDFAEPRLNAAVRRGRRREAKRFGWPDAGAGLPPDAEETFCAARLTPPVAASSALERWYQALLGLRRRLQPLGLPRAEALAGEAPAFAARWRGDAGEVLALFHLGAAPTPLRAPATDGRWRALLDGEADLGAEGREAVVADGMLTWDAPAFGVTVLGRGAID